MSLRIMLLRLAQRLLRTSFPRRPVRGLSAVSITAAVLMPTLQAQTAPPRPTGSAARDTVHRYGEKFVLGPSDSVVVRADTVWYPRAGSKGALPITPRATPAKPDTVAPPRASTGSGGGHRSHASHASHRSMIGYRSGR